MLLLYYVDLVKINYVAYVTIAVITPLFEIAGAALGTMIGYG